jgi:hypothetical protein
MRHTLLAFFAIAMFWFPSCIKDTLKTTYTYTIATPVYKTSAEVRASIKNSTSEVVSQPGKMYLYGSYLFLNEKGRGIHIINNTNPSAPVNEAFINIPGCEDMAVLGNTLYADCYSDLMVIDISNPKSVALRHFIHNIFPERQHLFGYSMDSTKVIANWIVRDTTVTFERELGGVRLDGGIFWFNSRAEFSVMTAGGAGSANQPTGRGGSMARFAITHNHLYAVTVNKLLALGLEKPMEPAVKSRTDLPWGIETIYPFKDKLFIGANSGMHIFTIQNPAEPKQAGTFTHARVCDPVIADDNYAYVTLRSGTNCFGNINQLDVVNVDDIFSPRLVKSYPLVNPKGLDKDGQWLYICDGTDGVKIMDAADVNNVRLFKTITVKDPFDVICYNKVAMVSAADGLHQYDINDVNNIRKLSLIGIQKN